MAPTWLSMQPLSYSESRPLLGQRSGGLGLDRSLLAAADEAGQIGLGDQDLARLGAFVAGDHAAALEHVDEAAGAGVADPQTALDHRDGGGFGLDHDAD